MCIGMKTIFTLQSMASDHEWPHPPESPYTSAYQEYLHLRRITTYLPQN